MKHKFEQRCDFSALAASRITGLKEMSTRALTQISTLSMELEHAHIKQYPNLVASGAMLAQLNNELIALDYLHKIEHGERALICVEYVVREFLATQAEFIKIIASSKNITDVAVVCDNLLLWEFDQLLLSAAVRGAALQALQKADSKILFTAAVENDFLKLSIEDDGAANSIVQDSFGIATYFAKTISVLHNVNNKHGYVELRDTSSIGGTAFSIYLPNY